jgi:DNA polymerase III subunit delta'
VPFRDIAGHTHLVGLLAAAARRGSLPPSLIFAGPDGVGKRLAAIALAQILNCQSPLENDACGTCASCTRIARGVHADVLIVEPGDTGAIKLDQVREAIDRTGYRPFEGRTRVIIIDRADAMLIEAQNALLKTLEEPPSTSRFVLVTSRPDVLLPTVRSRCQRLRFGRLSVQEVAAVLTTKHDYTSANAHAAAAASDGSIGVALAGESDDFVEARQAAVEVLQGVANASDPRRRLDSGKTLAGSGERDEVRRRLRALASMLRDLGALGAKADEGHLANADLRDGLRRLSGAFDMDRITRGFAAIDKALDAIDRNGSPKIVADWLAFQL